MGREITVNDVDIGCQVCSVTIDMAPDKIAVAGLVIGALSDTFNLCTKHIAMWKSVTKEMGAKETEALTGSADK